MCSRPCRLPERQDRRHVRGDAVDRRPTDESNGAADEHRFIEWFGSSESYRELRRRIRAYYLDNFPVSTKARAARWFNPGITNAARWPVSPAPRSPP